MYANTSPGLEGTKIMKKIILLITVVCISFASGYFLGKQNEDNQKFNDSPLSLTSHNSFKSFKSQASLTESASLGNLLESFQPQIADSSLSTAKQNTENQEVVFEEQTVDYLRSFIMHETNANLIYRAIDAYGEQASSSNEMLIVSSDILSKSDLGHDNILKVCKELSAWTLPESEVKDLILQSNSYAALSEPEQTEILSEVDDILEIDIEKDNEESAVQEGAQQYFM